MLFHSFTFVITRGFSTSFTVQLKVSSLSVPLWSGRHAAYPPTGARHLSPLNGLDPGGKQGPALHCCRYRSLLDNCAPQAAPSRHSNRTYLPHPVPLGHAAQRMPFLPNESNPCEKPNTWCSAVVPAQDTKKAPLGPSAPQLLATDPQVLGSSKVTFMICKVVGGEWGIRGNGNCADNTKDTEKSKSLKSYHFSVTPPRCWGPSL